MAEYQLGGLCVAGDLWLVVDDTVSTACVPEARQKSKKSVAIFLPPRYVQHSAPTFDLNVTNPISAFHCKATLILSASTSNYCRGDLENKHSGTVVSLETHPFPSTKKGVALASKPETV